MSTLTLLVLLPMIFAVQSCKDPLINECGCIRRPTFELDWLKNNHSDVAAQYKDSSFTAPVITYPNCSAIIATCPEGSRVVSFNLTTNKIDIDPVLFPNPTALRDLTCDPMYHEWYAGGLTEPIDDNLKSSLLSCIKP